LLASCASSAERLDVPEEEERVTLAAVVDETAVTMPIPLRRFVAEDLARRN
jgi:hypothetical protein